MKRAKKTREALIENLLTAAERMISAKGATVPLASDLGRALIDITNAVRAIRQRQGDRP